MTVPTMSTLILLLEGWHGPGQDAVSEESSGAKEPQGRETPDHGLLSHTDSGMNSQRRLLGSKMQVSEEGSRSGVSGLSSCQEAAVC